MIDGDSYLEITRIKALFLEKTSRGYQVPIICVFSLILIILDFSTNWLESSRSLLNIILTPVVIVAEFPSRISADVQKTFTGKGDLNKKIEALETELILLRVKTEKMAAFRAENARLRNLLGSAAKLQDDVLIAELIGVNPDPSEQEVLINKGFEDMVFLGQPVLDSKGLFGQIVEVNRFNSRVLLINDERHSVPVQILRNNLRLIAQGTGLSQQLELLHVSSTADIKVGDRLISSGLGNRFPVGSPVGLVAKVVHKPGKPFAEVTAKPNAQLRSSRLVLLVFSESIVQKRSNSYFQNGRDVGG